MTAKKGAASHKLPAKKRLAGLLPILISLFWFLVIVPDYLFHHPYYSQGISQFKYWGLVSVLAIISGAIYFFIHWAPEKYSKLKIRTLNGLKIYLLLFLVMNIILAWYGIANGLFQSNPIVHLSYFTGFIIVLHAAVLFIIILGYAAGTFLMRPFAGYLSNSSHQLISIALGLSLIGFVMVVLGLFKVLITWILWPMVVVLLALRYRQVGRFLKALLLTPVAVNNLKIQGFLGAALLIVFAAVNGMGALKVFPIGFDGAALYMNISKLIHEYHALPEGGQAYNWSVIMSLGHLLFGSTTVSILLSHLAGILCLMAIYRIARLFVSRSNSILAAALFYTAPFVTFHNYFDEKVDLGFLFISLGTLLLLLEFFKRKEKDQLTSNPPFLFKMGKITWTPDLLIWLYTGWLTGFAFGIKYTALFNIVALIGVLFYRRGGRLAFLGSLITALSFIFLLGIDRFTNFDMAGTLPVLLAGLLFVPGVALMGLAFRRSPMAMMRTIGIACIFSLAVASAFAPWGIKHFMENKTIAVSSLIQGKLPEHPLSWKPEYLVSRKKIEALRALPEEEKDAAANKTRREEVQRYIGFEEGLPLYLSLPYDLTMNTNLPGLTYLDIGFLWLLLLPLIFLTAAPKEKGHNLLILLLLLFLLLISLFSVYVIKASPILPEALVSQHPPGLSSSLGGVYLAGMDSLIYLAKKTSDIYEWLAYFNLIVSLGILLILLGVATWLASEKLRMLPYMLKNLLAFVVIYLFLWMLLGNGITWYAFPLLALLPILIVYYFQNPGQFLGAINERFSKYFLSLSIGLFLLLNLTLHFSDPDRGDNRHLIFKKPFIQYASGIIDQEETLANFNPFFQEALNYLNNDPSEKIYRVGTYLQYHITKNDQRILEDNQLGKFDELLQILSKEENFLDLLRNSGFRYILYDLKTASIDQTPEQSLVKKNNTFFNLLLNSGKVQLVVTDRIIQDPGGGMVQLPNGTVPGKPGLLGQPVYPGTFALFKIL